MRLEAALIVLALVAAMLHTLLPENGARPALRRALKLAAVAALLLLAVVRGGPVALIAALGLSVIADALPETLTSPRTGLRDSLFALAALAYAGLFLRVGGGLSALSAEPARSLVIAAGFALFVTLTAWLSEPSRHPSAVAILRAAVQVLALASALTLPLDLWPAMVGAVGLTVSNQLETLQRFRARPSALAAPWIWWLYFGGQCMIAYVCLR